MNTKRIELFKTKYENPNEVIFHLEVERLLGTHEQCYMSSLM